MSTSSSIYHVDHPRQQQRHQTGGNQQVPRSGPQSNEVTPPPSSRRSSVARPLGDNTRTFIEGMTPSPRYNPPNQAGRHSRASATASRTTSAQTNIVRGSHYNPPSACNASALTPGSGALVPQYTRAPGSSQPAHVHYHITRQSSDTKSKGTYEDGYRVARQEAEREKHREGLRKIEEERQYRDVKYEQELRDREEDLRRREEKLKERQKALRERESEVFMAELNSSGLSPGERFDKIDKFY